MEYLPFSHVDDSQGNFEEIVDRYTNSLDFFPGLLYGNSEIHFTLVNSENAILWNIHRVLSRSREIKLAKYDPSVDVAEQHRQQSLQKAIAIQWLCFTPPSTIKDVKDVTSKLLLRSLMHRYAQISIHTDTCRLIRNSVIHFLSSFMENELNRKSFLIS